MNAKLISKSSWNMVKIIKESVYRKKFFIFGKGYKYPAFFGIFNICTLSI